MQRLNEAKPKLCQSYPKGIHFRKGFSQAGLAKELGISKSYLSMILSGQRNCPAELIEKLQSIPGIHKVVNNQLWLTTGSQKVVGSNPISSTNSDSAHNTKRASKIMVN